jgi:HPt (histidine-containing phosphotransfer) domain-containing protein
MTNKETLPAQLPGVNVNETLERTGISAEVLRRILLKFAEKNRLRDQELAALLAGGDLPGLGVMVHTLKGAAATIGATALQELCLEVEQAVAAGKGSAELQVVLRELARALHEVVAGVDALA